MSKKTKIKRLLVVLTLTALGFIALIAAQVIADNAEADDDCPPLGCDW